MSERTYALLVRIEGIGDGAGQWTFCTVAPAYGDATYKPWLSGPPDLLSERVDLAGGLPEASSCAFGLVDIDDALTALLVTESEAFSRVLEDVDGTETSIEVGNNTGLTDLVVWLGSEAMLVTATASSPTRITVTRGALGTEATTHQASDPFFLSPNYLEGRQFVVLFAPLDAPDESSETEVGRYVLERLSWSSDLNVWKLAGSSQQRYLDRQAPLKPATVTVLATYDDGPDYIDEGRLYVKNTEAQRALWPDRRLYLRSEGTLLRVEEYGGALPQVAPAYVYTNVTRGLLGTSRDAPGVGTRLHRVFVADGDLRYSPGPSPSTSRTSGAWTPATHWIDLLLILLLSSADEYDGLELTNTQSTSGSDWAKSNFSSLPPGYGAGIPASLIDWGSFDSARARSLAYRLPAFVYGDAPQSFADFIRDQFLRPAGAYLSMENGLVRLALARVPVAGETSLINGESLVTLNEDSILRQEVSSRQYLPAVSASRDRAAVAGAVMLELGPQRVQAIARNADWGRTYGQRGWYGAVEPVLKIPIRGAAASDAELWAQRAAARLWRQHRPPVTLELDVLPDQWLSMIPGGLALVTLPELPAMATGTRGWSEVTAEIAERELRAEIGRSRDGEALGLTATLRVRRYAQSLRVGRICPMAYVHAVRGEYAYVYRHRGTRADANAIADPGLFPLPSTDAAGFTLGDLVVLVDPDGAVLESTPQEVVDIATDGAWIQLDGDFAGALAADTLIVYAATDDSRPEQTDFFVHHADADDQTVGSTTQSPWKWGEL